MCEVRSGTLGNGQVRAHDPPRPERRTLGGESLGRKPSSVSPHIHSGEARQAATDCQWEESERSTGGGEFQGELSAEIARHGRKERFRGTGRYSGHVLSLYDGPAVAGGELRNSLRAGDGLSTDPGVAGSLFRNDRGTEDLPIHDVASESGVYAQGASTDRWVDGRLRVTREDDAGRICVGKEVCGFSNIAGLDFASSLTGLLENEPVAAARVYSAGGESGHGGDVLGIEASEIEADPKRVQACLQPIVGGRLERGRVSPATRQSGMDGEFHGECEFGRSVGG